MELVSDELIQKIKSATVAVGVMQAGNTKPIRIFGSGCVIDPEGYILSASHVLIECIKFCEKIKEEKGIELRPAIFSYITVGNDTNALFSAIDQKSFLRIKTPDGDIDLDVVVFDLLAKDDNLPFLQITSKKKYKILDDVMMCGYPGGEATLKVAGGIMDLRLSPLLYVGKISGFIPLDNVDKPQAIQTDIFTTGGSSGSPILDMSDGSIVGIAQTVIGSGLNAIVSYDDSQYVFTSEDLELHETVIPKKSFVEGIAQIGPVTGISFNMLQGVSTLIDEMKKGNTNVTDLTMEYTRVTGMSPLEPHKQDKKE